MDQLFLGMGAPIEELLDQYWSFGVLLQLLIPIVLLVHRMPLRNRALLRVSLVVSVLFGIAVLPFVWDTASGLNEMQSFCVFSCLLALFVCAIHLIYDTSLWTAVFCAVAGYTIQNIASSLSLFAQSIIMESPRRGLHGLGALAVMWGIPLLVYLGSYFVFVRKLKRQGLTGVENRAMLLMFVISVVAVIGFDLIIKNLVYDGISFEQATLLRLVHLIVCAFLLFAEYQLLYAKHADNERAETERLLAEHERQYRLSRENIEAINIKCHDIRHQIRALASGGAVVDGAVLADIEREISVYDSTVKTGNEALDTILTEKRLMCSTEGIALSVVADGSALGFMAPADIYALFGNALDNAIEAVRGVADPDQRAITVLVQRRHDMVSVNVENCFAEAPRFSADGLPLTSKGDRANHGFGMRSMRAAAARYGGSLHAGAEDGVFYLNVLLDPLSARGR